MKKIAAFLSFSRVFGASVFGSGDSAVNPESCGDSYQLYVSQWILDNAQLTTDRDYAYYYDDYYDYYGEEVDEEEEGGNETAEVAKNVTVSCGVPMFADEADRTPTCSLVTEVDEEHIVDTGRILGANEAIPHSHPWLAALQIKKVKEHFYFSALFLISVEKTLLQRVDSELEVDHHRPALSIQRGKGRNCGRSSQTVG